MRGADSVNWRDSDDPLASDAVTPTLVWVGTGSVFTVNVAD